jgi:branched-chain amino acid transport system substrate-binding protein
MKKTLLWVIGIVVVVFIVVSVAGKKQSESGPIRVGFISSLTGEAGVWGQGLKKGFDFALEEINKNGGINNRQIQGVYGDDECNATKGVSVYNQIAVIDKVKIITGPVCSSVALSVVNTTQSNKVLYIASGATDPTVTEKGDLIFRLWVSDDYEAKAIAQYAWQTLNVKSFGIAYVNDNPAGVTLKSTFEKTVKELGGTVLGSESYSGTERNFRTQLTKLLSKNPDALYLMALPQQTATIINEARTLGYKGVILGYSPSLTSPETVSQIKDKSKIYYSTPKNQQTTSFWSDYKNKTGQDADQFIALGYDSLKIISGGIKKCGEDNACIAKYLSDLKDYQSARGKLNFDSGRNLTGIEFDSFELK